MGKTDVKVILVLRKKQREGGGSKKPRQSAHNKATRKYERQRIRTGGNRMRKLRKHIKCHPNDLCAIKKQQNVKY